jgi:putative ABC transport system substrate-binding protein
MPSSRDWVWAQTSLTSPPESSGVENGSGVSYDSAAMLPRRDFLGALTAGLLAAPGGAAAPGRAAAQPRRKVYRIGIVNFSPPTSAMTGPEPRNEYTNAFVRGLRELGYVYGEHFVTEPRGAEGKAEQFPIIAAELVRLRPDVIVAVGTSQPAFKQATSTIPIVMAGSYDPVGEGLVQSLGRPGTNFTGLSFQDLELTGKRLELLKELVPGPAPVAVLWGQGGRWGQAGPRQWQAAALAARERGWKLLSFEIRDVVAEIEGTFRAAVAARAGAVLVPTSGPFTAYARRVADVAAKHRLPVMYPFRLYVDLGGLMSYGADLIEIWRTAAVFVDKILKGASPGTIPVEQPRKFELIVNTKSAKALGLTIPSTLLVRADHVIQ